MGLPGNTPFLFKLDPVFMKYALQFLVLELIERDAMEMVNEHILGTYQSQSFLLDFKCQVIIFEHPHLKAFIQASQARVEIPRDHGAV